MVFHPDFFKEEQREGFLVSSLMKKCWAAELKTLQVLLDFCKEHQLKVYADYGTLLGAIRHKGFIPWDDDIDVSMPRNDYMKLLELADDYPKPYRIKSIHAMDRFSQFHTTISNSRREKFTYDPSLVENFYGCPFFVEIDIFPYDVIPQSSDLQRMQLLLYRIGFQLSSYLAYDWVRIEHQKVTVGKGTFDNACEQHSPEEFSKLLQTFCTYTGTTLPLDQQLQKNIMLLTDQIAMRFSSEACDHLAYYPDLAYMDSDYSPRPSYVQDRLIEVPFENIMLPVPEDYETLLRCQYGTDWRTPIQGASDHNYPFYQRQLEILQFEGHTDFL